MKDFNGFGIQRGWVLKGNNSWYCRVLFVGKERVITAANYLTLEEARNTEYAGSSWSRKGVNNNQMVTVQTRPLGVYDSTGKEYYVGSMVGESEVFDAIKSLNDNDENYVLFKDKGFPGGWAYLTAKIHTITSTPFETPDIKVDFKIWVNGKESKEPLSVETAMRLGIIR